MQSSRLCTDRDSTYLGGVGSDSPWPHSPVQTTPLNTPSDHTPLTNLLTTPQPHRHTPWPDTHLQPPDRTPPPPPPPPVDRTFHHTLYVVGNNVQPYIFHNIFHSCQTKNSTLLLETRLNEMTVWAFSTLYLLWFCKLHLSQDIIFQGTMIKNSPLLLAISLIPVNNLIPGTTMPWRMRMSMKEPEGRTSWRWVKQWEEDMWQCISITLGPYFSLRLRYMLSWFHQVSSDRGQGQQGHCQGWPSPFQCQVHIHKVQLI